MASPSLFPALHTGSLWTSLTVHWGNIPPSCPRAFHPPPFPDCESVCRWRPSRVKPCKEGVSANCSWPALAGIPLCGTSATRLPGQVNKKPLRTEKEYNQSHNLTVLVRKAAPNTKMKSPLKSGEEDKQYHNEPGPFVFLLLTLNDPVVCSCTKFLTKTSPNPSSAPRMSPHGLLSHPVKKFLPCVSLVHAYAGVVLS